MKRVSILLLACLLTACAYETPHLYKDSGESYRLYDENGDYAGHVDGTYRVYDKDGNFVGTIRR